MAPKVLLCGAVNKNIVWAQKEVESLLGSIAEPVPFTSSTKEEFYSDLKGKYSDIVAIYRHNSSADSVGVFDKALIEALPSSVKLIAHNGAGYDQIDIAAASARDIAVTHTPGAVDDATATTGVFLTLSALRGYWRAQTNARSGKWKAGLQPAKDPEGKTLGVVGMGGIGSVMARRLQAFGMNVIYHNRRPISPEPDFPCKYVSTLKELLEQSDVVSLNLPLNENTKGKFGKQEFGWMKDDSVLVNTARGGVVDEEALIEALESGKLYSAGLDVFPNEPEINPRLVAMENITLLPHMGTETKDTQHKMEIQVLKNIAAFIKGEPLPNQVAEQKK